MMIVGFSLKYIDSIFEIVMVAVMVLISLYSYSVFKLLKEQKFKWFSYSFFIIALAFVGRILMNIVIYTQEIRKKLANVIIITFKSTSASNTLWHYGLFSYRTLMLLGLIGIFLIITNSRKRKNLLLLFYLAVLTAFTSMRIPYVFSITSAVILALITLQLYQNYLHRPKKSALGVAIAFCVIFLSHIIFIFEGFSHLLYILGEVVQLAGYLLLLAVYISILRK